MTLGSSASLTFRDGFSGTVVEVRLCLLFESVTLWELVLRHCVGDGGGDLILYCLVARRLRQFQKWRRIVGFVRSRERQLHLAVVKTRGSDFWTVAERQSCDGPAFSVKFRHLKEVAPMIGTMYK